MIRAVEALLIEVLALKVPQLHKKHNLLLSTILLHLKWLDLR